MFRNILIILNNKFDFIKKFLQIRDLTNKINEEQNTEIRKVLEAIINKIKSKYSSDENKNFKRIENARKFLLKSKDEISINDYGAVSALKTLTEEEMYNGRVVKKTIGNICKTASSSSKWALILYNLIKEFKFENCIELGTSLGFSGAYQLAALKNIENGKLYTFEGADTIAHCANKNLSDLGFDNNNYQIIIGRFQDTLHGVLNNIPKIDFAFIDGHHNQQATIKYYQQIYPHLSDTAIIIFDDINWSLGMRAAWREIITDVNITASFDLNKYGICLFTADKNYVTKHFNINY